VYTASKSRLLSNKIMPLSDGVPTHIISSLIAGTVATTVCAPADVLKSRLQSANGKSNVSRETASWSFIELTVCQGIVKIVVDSMKREGPGFLMKGWTPAWLRLA
jgi:dicarboxylate transporter 10